MINLKTEGNQLDNLRPREVYSIKKKKLLTEPDDRNPSQHDEPFKTSPGKFRVDTLPSERNSWNFNKNNKSQKEVYLKVNHTSRKTFFRDRIFSAYNIRSNQENNLMSKRIDPDKNQGQGFKAFFFKKVKE